MAECPNCGRSYQAPDSMAGKRVRCKQCQTVFQIPAPPAGGEAEVDFDQLARDVDDGAFAEGDATAAATAMAGTAVGGPAVDEHGRASIRRSGDVSAFSVRGDASAGGPMRTNLRFRYPMARQVDVGLPWLMLLLGLGVPLWLSLTRGATLDEHPSAGVGTTRYAVLLIAFLLLVFPATHLAIAKAGRDARFNLPRTPIWRSLAAALGTLLMGATLFILSGGTLGGIILGLLVGVCTTVLLALLLFRTLPHEMSTVSLYTAVGTGLGAGVAALLIFGLNFAAASIARTASNPTLFQSPIAVGAPWVEEPAKVAEKPKPRPPVAGKPPTTVGTDPTTAVAVVTPPAAKLQSLPVEQFVRNEAERKFVKAVDRPPINSGFAELLVPLVPSPALGVVRPVESGLLELWDTANWTLPEGRTGKNFSRAQPLFVNTTGDRVVRLVSSPVLRVEPVRLEAGTTPPFVKFTNPSLIRRIEGFRGPGQLIVRVRVGEGIAFEEYDLDKPGAPLVNPPARPMSATPADGDAAAAEVPTPLGVTRDGASGPMLLRDDAQSIKFAPDGSVVAIGRDGSRSPEWPTCIALVDLADPGRARRVVDVPWGDPGGFVAQAASVNDAGRVALLLDAGGDAYLTVWRLRTETVDGNAVEPGTDPLVDARLGALGNLRAGRWSDRAEPMIWLDQKTLLLWGRTLVDATTGDTIGTVNIPNVVGQYRLADGEVLFHTETDGVNNLLRVQYDTAAIAAAARRG